MEEKNISFLDYASELKDPRMERRKLHGMMEILLLTLAGVICGCEGWNDIEEFGKCQIENLKRYLPYKNGVPSDDTLRRFFRNLDPEAFSKVFSQWVRDVLRPIRGNEKTEVGQTIAIDGKTTRRSFDYDDNNDKKALHLVNAFVTDLRIVLSQQKTKEGSNEITAIPELLEVIDVSNATVTIDAMGCQRKIAQKIIEKKGDYLLSVKGNQADLLDEIKIFFEIEGKENFKNIKHDKISTTEKGHGRIETRSCITTDQIGWLYKKGEWDAIKSIACIESKRLIKGKETIEKRYYITSLSPSAEKILHAARSHWGIENSMHWVLDVCFNDDLSRIRKGYAPQNIATIKSAALNLLKLAQPKRTSIKCLRKIAGWDSTTLHLIVKQI